MLILLAAFALSGLGIGLGLWQVNANSGAKLTKVEASLVATDVPADSGSPRDIGSLNAFRSTRSSADTLPAVLVREAVGMGSTQAGALGLPRILSSRRVAVSADGRLALYAWPIGHTGVCIGVSSRATGCVRAFGSATQIAPPLIATESGSTVIGGLVSDDVSSVRVRAGGASCSAPTPRNGFVCALALPSGARSVSIRMQERSGSSVTESLPLG